MMPGILRTFDGLRSRASVIPDPSLTSLGVMMICSEQLLLCSNSQLAVIRLGFPAVLGLGAILDINIMEK